MRLSKMLGMSAAAVLKAGMPVDGLADGPDRSRPNVILIKPDDMGQKCVSAYGRTGSSREWTFLWYDKNPVTPRENAKFPPRCLGKNGALQALSRWLLFRCERGAYGADEPDHSHTNTRLTAEQDAAFELLIKALDSMDYMRPTDHAR